MRIRHPPQIVLVIIKASIVLSVRHPRAQHRHQWRRGRFGPPLSRDKQELCNTIGAKIITYTSLGVPYYDYSIMG